MTKEYAIAIRLNPEFAAKAQELNSTFAEHLPGLKNPSNVWHVTLYHGAYKEEELPEIWGKVQKLDMSNITLNFSEIYTTSDRWIDWLVEKTPELCDLHKSVVELASPYHQGHLQRCADIYDQITDAQKALVDEYGVSGILDAYKPHTTLFYQFPPDAELQNAATQVPSSIPMSCKVESIILGELGYNGNIIDIVYESAL